MRRWRATGVHVEIPHRDGCQEPVSLSHVAFTDITSSNAFDMNGPRGSALVVRCFDYDCPMRAVIHQHAIEALLEEGTP